jgi:hypothetical protein
MGKTRAGLGLEGWDRVEAAVLKGMVRWPLSGRKRRVTHACNPSYLGG